MSAGPRSALSLYLAYRLFRVAPTRQWAQERLYAYLAWVYFSLSHWMGKGASALPSPPEGWFVSRYAQSTVRQAAQDSLVLPACVWNSNSIVRRCQMTWLSPSPAQCGRNDSHTLGRTASSLCARPAPSNLSVAGVYVCVGMCRSETFDQAVSFGHEAESGDKATSGVISTLRFSPNSRFVLTAARDGELRLWDLLRIQTPVEVDHHLMADAAVALVWHAAANLVAVVDVGGEWGIWNGVVPPHVGSATAAIDAAAVAAAFAVTPDAEAEALAGQEEAADTVRVPTPAASATRFVRSLLSWFDRLA